MKIITISTLFFIWISIPKNVDMAFDKTRIQGYENLIHFVKPLCIKVQNGVLRFLQPSKDIDQYGRIVVGPQENIIVICPGEFNCIARNRRQQIKNFDPPSDCPKHYKFFHNVYRATDIMDIQSTCFLPFMSEYRIKSRDNPKGTVTYEVGFQVTNVWLPLYIVCANHLDHSTFYTIHEIYGDKYLATNTAIPIEQIAKAYTQGSHLFGKFNLLDLYKTKTQRATLEKILGHIKRTYIDSYMRLELTPYVPADNFYFGAWKMATFYYFNTYPVWNTVKHGNLAKVNTIIKKYAHMMQRKFLIYTGGIEVLTLETPNYDKYGKKVGQGRPIYLNHQSKERKFLPVWKHLFKILYDDQTKNAIVFVTLNNPYMTENERVMNMLCPDICKGYGWHGLADESFFSGYLDEGYTICCDARFFLSLFNYLPRLEVKGVITLGWKERVEMLNAPVSWSYNQNTNVNNDDPSPSTQ